MLVDDHSGFRQVVKSLLQTGEVEFSECADGKEAVEEYPRFMPDVVLMDVAMEVMDGLKATAHIKARFPGARVYILTQYDDAELREAARQAGACAYLLKDDLSQLPALIHLPPPFLEQDPRLPDPGPRPSVS